MAGRATRAECAQSCVSVAIPSGLKAKVSSQVALLVGVLILPKSAEAG